MRALVVFFFFLLPLPALAAANTFSADQKTEIQGIVKEYLVSNPEVTQMALDSLKEKLIAEDANKEAQLVLANKAQLEQSPSSPTGGNPNGDVTVVEFFDYNCGYCRLTKPIINSLISSDAGVRVVYKEFPILSDTSTAAAKAALSAHRQGKYEAYHNALFGFETRLGQSEMDEAATKAGLDLDKWRTDQAAPEIDSEIGDNHRLARTLGIGGTPAFVIGGKVYRGAMDLEGMKSAISAVRESKK